MLHLEYRLSDRPIAERPARGRSRALPGGSPDLVGRVVGAKEGARGGTMGSPTLKREDALIMWREAVTPSEKAS
jgi:hypothetical protein